MYPRPSAHLAATLAAIVALAATPGSPTALAAAPRPGLPTVAEGVLVDAGGKPTAGTLLLNLLDPDPHANAAPLLAMGTAGPGGRFRLVLLPSRQLAARAAANDGYLNMRLLAVTAAGKGVALISRRWSSGGWEPNVGGTWLRVTANAPLSARQREQLTRLQRAGAAAQARASRGEASVDLTAATMAGAVAPGSDNPYCTRVNDRFLARYTVIGELHTWRDMTATFTYGTTADSEISTGFSFDGGSSWTLGGQIHVGTSTSTLSSMSVSSNYYGRQVKSQFEFVRYHYTGWFCYDDTVYQSPWRWTGGGIVAGSSQTAYDGRCGTTYPYAYLYGKDTTFERRTNDFVNWSAAANVLGLSLEAQTGASSNAGLRYAFGSATAYHRICGSDDYPYRAERVFAGP